MSYNSDKAVIKGSAVVPFTKLRVLFVLIPTLHCKFICSIDSNIIVAHFVTVMVSVCLFCSSLWRLIHFSF